MILHIDMDAFFASIEQAINPRLKGKPLIVGSRPDKMHTVVCAASYQAKALGICSGMNSREAFSICPQLQFVTADQSKYIWTSEQIHDMLKIYGFRLNYASIDEFRMDILNHPQPTALAEDIRQRIHSRFNITASVGIAGNCLLAKLASKLNKPNGIAIMDDSNLEPILARTPVDKLCGIGKSTNILLRSLGLETCLDLYLKSPQFMQRHLGKAGLNLYAGLHSSESFQQEPLEDSQPKSIGHSYTFPRASKNPGFIKAWIRLLSEMVAARLRQKSLESSCVALWLNSPEKGNFSAQKTFSRATNDGYEIYLKALKIMAKMSLQTPKIRALGVSCQSLSKAEYPPLLIEEKRREDLIQALDRINERFGEHTVFPAVISLSRKMQ